MKKFLVVVLVAVCLIALPSAGAQGQTYYVDPDGSDETGDGSQGNPWRTIVYAATQVAAGDMVLVNPGTYDGGIVVDTDGTETAPITFRANGAGVVIEGSGGDRDAFFITEADYIVVEGFTIQHADRAGLRISLSDHVTVRDCTFADNGRWGVFTDFSDYTTVEDCESHGAVEEHGIYISNSSDYPTIRGNRLYDNHGCGLHMNGDISMGGDGIISYGLVEDNIIYNNGEGGGSGINMDGVTDTMVRNNLLYDNHASGISIYQIDGGSGSQNNRVLNNTIIVAADGRWAINIPDVNDTGNKVFNNIAFTHHGWRGSIVVAAPAVAGFESDYNVVMDRFSVDGGDSRISLAEWQALGYDTHSFIATPDQLFVDPVASDYHLRIGSPAIDSGTLLDDVVDDLEGTPRPIGPTHDIGAYEYHEDYGFTLTASPSAQHIAPGEIATYTLSIQPIGSFSATVDLVAASPSPSLTLSLTPAAVSPPGQSTLRVADTHPGPTLIPGLQYNLPVTATGDGITQTTSVSLLVGGARYYLPLILKGVNSETIE